MAWYSLPLICLPFLTYIHYVPTSIFMTLYELAVINLRQELIVRFSQYIDVFIK